MVYIGNKLKELRKASHLTQEELSSKLGISRVNYTRYETGASRPDYETLLHLADYFNVSVDYLLGRTDNPAFFK